jgi:coproporphyrinogen III oxidase-like Fe-S oxidoreductase
VFYKRPPTLPLEDTLADIQEAGEAVLRGQNYRQYEVSAYSLDNSHCRHNINYWSFGDYLGIGAGAHGKISFPDGRITRCSKRRQPSEYMSAGSGEFTASHRDLARPEIAGEFMLNALRLNNGFSLAQFSARTGLPWEKVEEKVEALVANKLLVRPGDTVRLSDLGRRFLDSVVAEFF